MRFVGVVSFCLTFDRGAVGAGVGGRGGRVGLIQVIHEIQQLLRQSVKVPIVFISTYVYIHVYFNGDDVLNMTL